MNLSEIKEKIKDERAISSEQKSRYFKTEYIIRELEYTKRELELNLFNQFIEIGFRYEMKGYVNFDGVCITKGDEDNMPIFNKGDIIEAVKRNKKSIVFKVIKRTYDGRWKIANKYKKVDDGKEVLFRLSSESLFSKLTRDTEFRSKFELWTKREESLNILL